MSCSTLAAVFALLGFGLIFLYWKRSHRSIAHLPGPPSESWLVGNIPSFRRAETASEADFAWTKKYGSAFRLKGCFGEDILYLADAKAMSYVLNRRGYNYSKSLESHALVRLSIGRGILAMDGANHARHRRIMNLSFSNAALKVYFPFFLDFTGRTTTAWKAMIRNRNEESPVLDVWALLSRTTLDIIGQVAFDYKFNSIESVEPKTDLHKAYQNFFIDVNYMQSDFDIVFRKFLSCAPHWLLDRIKKLPRKNLQRLTNYSNVARKVAKGLVEKQTRVETSGKQGGRDVMSILVRANNAEDPKRQLEEVEILDQISALLLAGHETTASALSWTLYELSKHPEAQQTLRDEVRATRAEVASREDSQVTISDLDSMTYTIAVMKETLRYHTIAEQIYRRAVYDDVIPLGTAQQTAAGDTITAIPVRKGQLLYLGLASYNRLPSVWGQDADEWRPERFLEEPPNAQKTDHLGIFGNLASFSSGLRSCIGWRFALVEMQTVLFELIDNFAFSPAPNVEIKRVTSGVMQSLVKGQERKGSQLPLTVTLLTKGDAD